MIDRVIEWSARKIMLGDYLHELQIICSAHSSPNWSAIRFHSISFDFVRFRWIPLDFVGFHLRVTIAWKFNGSTYLEFINLPSFKIVCFVPEPKFVWLALVTVEHNKNIRICTRTSYVTCMYFDFKWNLWK